MVDNSTPNVRPYPERFYDVARKNKFTLTCNVAKSRISTVMMEGFIKPLKMKK